MKKYITLLIISFGLSAQAQVNISYSAGYGGYRMKNANMALESVFNTIRANLPRELRITEDFPGYITHNLDLTYQMSSHEAGIKVSYYTTGGIIAYSDYSGKYKNSSILNGYRFGLIYRNHFWILNDRFSLFFDVSPAMIRTGIKSDLEYSYSNLSILKKIFDKDSESAVSIQTLLGCRFSATKDILIFGRVGYDFLLISRSDPFSSRTNPKMVDWSGVRCEIGVTWQLSSLTF